MKNLNLHPTQAKNFLNSREPRAANKNYVPFKCLDEITSNSCDNKEIVQAIQKLGDSESIIFKTNLYDVDKTNLRERENLYSKSKASKLSSQEIAQDISKLINNPCKNFHIDYSKNVETKQSGLCGGQEFYGASNIECSNIGPLDKSCTCPQQLTGKFCESCNCGKYGKCELDFLTNDVKCASKETARIYPGRDNYGNRHSDENNVEGIILEPSWLYPKYKCENSYCTGRLINYCFEETNECDRTSTDCRFDSTQGGYFCQCKDEFEIIDGNFKKCAKFEKTDTEPTEVPTTVRPTPATESSKPDIIVTTTKNSATTKSSTIAVPKVATESPTTVEPKEIMQSHEIIKSVEETKKSIGKEATESSTIPTPKNTKESPTSAKETTKRPTQVTESTQPEITEASTGSTTTTKSSTIAPPKIVTESSTTAEPKETTQSNKINTEATTKREETTESSTIATSKGT